MMGLPIGGCVDVSAGVACPSWTRCAPDLRPAEVPACETPLTMPPKLRTAPGTAAAANVGMNRVIGTPVPNGARRP